MSVLLEISNLARECPQRFYATAAIANAAAHPSLAQVLVEEGGLEVMQDIDDNAAGNIHLLGSKMGECALTALYLLSHGDKGYPLSQGIESKYSFKWGTQPTMDLTVADYSSTANGRLLLVCSFVWVGMVFYTFSPALFGPTSGRGGDGDGSFS